MVVHTDGTRTISNYYPAGRLTKEEIEYHRAYTDNGRHKGLRPIDQYPVYHDGHWISYEQHQRILSREGKLPDEKRGSLAHRIGKATAPSKRDVHKARN